MTGGPTQRALFLEPERQCTDAPEQFRRAYLISGVFAATASAQTTTNYHPDGESRTFATRDGGWIGSTSFDNGLCVAGVTCPATDEAFVANGGAGGPADGFLRTEVAGTASLASVAHVTETSPSFVYQGAAGKTP